MIYCVVGPTGVGKTKLSVMLAKKTNAIIINCDSMQIYKEMNIGTAKITEDEKCGIDHYLFSYVSVNDDYSAYKYQTDAREFLDKFKDRNIVIVGGTGLYLKTLLYDYTFDNSGDKNKKLYDFKLIGLTRDRSILYNNIDLRVDKMIESGLLEEVRSLYDSGIRSRAVMTAIGYKELYDYFSGYCSLDDAISLIKQSSRRYAKRQYTFFNHQFDNIKWYDIDKISFDDIVLDIIKN